MIWKDDIEATLTVSGLLRVGSGRTGLEVDLPIARERLANGEMDLRFATNMASSLRGILRKSVHRIIRSTNLGSLVDLEESVFGAWVTSERQREGKLHIALMPLKEELTTTNRTGIRIDEVFGSVTPEALFIYEAIEGKQGSSTLKFTLKFSFPIDDREAAILLAGLNGLLYDSIGGFASRGLGIIEKIEVDPMFHGFALQHLTKLLVKEGR